MDFVAFLRVLLRRWVVVGAGLILTLVVTIAAGGSLGPSYEAEGSVLLLGPSTDFSSEEGSFPTNPYLYINPSVHSTALILAEFMSSDEVAGELADVGATADYEVTSTEKTPILTIAAQGAREEQVLHTARLVLQRLGDELVAQQQAAGAPAHTLIRSQVLSPPRASIHTGNKVRVMAVVGILGLGMTFMLVLVVESLAARRGRLRQLKMPLPAAGPILPPPPVPSRSPAPTAATSAAAGGNGFPPRPPSGPLVEVLVPTVKPPRADEPGGSAVEEAAASGDPEQHDGVRSWWSAWSVRQTARQAAQEDQAEELEAAVGAPADDRPENAEETDGEKQA